MTIYLSFSTITFYKLFYITLFLNDNWTVAAKFLILNFFSVICMFCSIAFEQDNLDLRRFINAVVITIIIS